MYTNRPEEHFFEDKDMCVHCLQNILEMLTNENRKQKIGLKRSDKKRDIFEARAITAQYF